MQKNLYSKACKKFKIKKSNTLRVAKKTPNLKNAPKCKKTLNLKIYQMQKI